MARRLQDTKICRAIFIDRSVEVREQLSYADPAEVLRATAVYCCDGYGAMLWPLAEEPAQQYFRAWNTAVKLTHRVSRKTFTYLTEGFLAGSETSLRNQVLGRFPGFMSSLLESPSPEVRFLARVTVADKASVTSENCQYLERLSGLSPVKYCSARIKSALPRLAVPPEQQWRLGLLSSLLALRKEKYRSQEDTDREEAMLISLCST